jgi:hypothetical protein
MNRRITVLVGLLLLAAPAQAQLWRTGPTATSDPVVNQRALPGGIYWYTVSGASTTDSGMLDVSQCVSLVLTHIKLASTDTSKFNLRSGGSKDTPCSGNAGCTGADTPNDCCTGAGTGTCIAPRLRCADYGLGPLCPAAPDGWFNGDDSSDVDGDSLNQLRNSFWWGPDAFVCIDVGTAPSGAEVLKAMLVCGH